MNQFLRTVAIIFVASLLFGSGWAIGELRHASREQSTRDLLKTSMELAVDTAAMTDKALAQTVACQETLNICLRQMGFKTLTPRSVP